MNDDKPINPDLDPQADYIMPDQVPPLAQPLPSTQPLPQTQPQQPVLQQQFQNQPLSQPLPSQFPQSQPPPPAPVSAGQNSLPPVSFYEPEPKQGGNKMSFVKKLVKIFIGIFVVLAFVLIMIFAVLPNLTGNSGGGGKVTLTYWGLLEDKAVMQGVISDFEKQNPNIKIDYSKQDIKQYRERLLTRSNNGTGPDIFRFHNTWYPMLTDVLLPLPNDTISKEQFNTIFYPVIQKDLIKNGAIYGLPLGIDTLSLFINTQMLQSAGLSTPSTWNDFINVARAMTVKDESGKILTSGAAMGTYDNITHAPDIISLLFLQNGVDFNNIPASAERVQGALSFYTSFATDQSNVWDNTLDPSMLAFSKGSLGMFFGYSWDYFTIKQFNPNLSFQIVPVPQLPNQNKTLASYWVEGVSAKSTHQKEALLFMKFLARKDTAEKLYADQAKTRAFGEPYARIDLADKLKTDPNVYTFVLQAPNASSSLFVDSTYDDGINQQVNTYLGNAVNSILNDGAVVAAFETFSLGVSQMLQKYAN